MNIKASKKTQQKLKNKHGVTMREVEQCFENLEGGFLRENREQHDTNPQSLWFIAPTNNCRHLKIVFVFDDGICYIKTAYEPNPTEVRMYKTHC